ncbi:19756_t:CDS:2, partial [Entrophospora sp. SA101]
NQINEKIKYLINQIFTEYYSLGTASNVYVSLLEWIEATSKSEGSLMLKQNDGSEGLEPL